MPEIVISEPMDEAAVATLSARFEVVMDPRLADDRAGLLRLLRDARALIVCNRTLVDQEALAAAPALRVVGRLGAAPENIDTAACIARGVEVILAQGANADSVAEYVLLAAGLLLRQAFAASEEISSGSWPRAKYSEGRELAGKLLGLVGFGSIGQCTAQKARAFGLRLAAYDPLRAPDDPVWRALGTLRLGLDDLIAESDIVSLHLPLSNGSRNLLDRARLARMKRGAILVNTAAGGIVDETALAELLRFGRIGGAAVDVFADEPLPVRSALASAPNTLLTPHVAGLTVESSRRVSTLVAGKVAQALAPR